MPDGKPCSAVAPWLRLQLWLWLRLQLCLQLQLQLQLKPVCLCKRNKHKKKTECAWSEFEFAFAWHLEWFFGLADAVRKLMHGQTLIHSCGDLMIPKRLKLLMKVLRRLLLLQRLLRMPSTLSETPSLFFLCPAQITQAAAAAATGNQHKISAFHCCSCCYCCCFFVAHFAESTIWLRFRVNTFYVPAKPAAAAAAAR